MLKNADFLSAMAKIAAFFVGQLRSSVPNEPVDLADRAGDWTKSGKVLHWTRFAIGLLPPVIKGVMSEIQFCDECQAYAALSLLRDEPESEIAKCFAAPVGLRGTRLIDSHLWRFPLTQGNFFQGTENLTDVLEVVCYSPIGMLQRLGKGTNLLPK